MLEKEILNTVKKYNLIEQNDTIICGISGGPDSMCMLDNLRKIKENNILNFELIVAHVNHQIREEADQDEEYVINYCKKHNIKNYVKRVDVKNMLTIINKELKKQDEILGMIFLKKY